METKVIKVKVETFEADLLTCLTILSENNGVYECEYITPALEKRIVFVSLI